jgi:CubicO group peptidase (beta-lactamase class C family)
MTRPFRSLAIGLIAAFAVAPLALRPSAQQAHRPAAAVARNPDRNSRDLAAAPPESVGISSERLRRIDAAMVRLVDEKQVAGLVTLLERHGKIVHFNAFGKLDVRKPEPAQKDSIFRIYSMTKPVTGVAMMMLYEEGKWRLDDPVARYIPDFARLKVYAGKNDDGSPKLEDAKRSMTMRELMTHTGGLGYVLNANNPVDKMIIDANVLNARAPLQDMITGVAKIPLLAQPGTRPHQPRSAEDDATGNRMGDGLSDRDRCRRCRRFGVERDFQLVRDRRHLVLDRPGRGSRVRRDGAAPESRHHARDSRLGAQPGLPGGDRVAPHA